MAAAVYEPYADESLKETSRLDDLLRPGAPQPEEHESPGGGAPLFVYRWSAVESVLHALAADDSASEFDGVTIDYGQGDWTMSTMSCRMSMLRPGERTKAHRHTYSSGVSRP